ncbi:MAG: hypothetical protein KJN99_14345 [Marinicaulis sp.]|nr:hypothetical protein [Marinicaulis sp.]
MLLRRITEHVKAQNWFAVGLDFLIVVVGVFVGLQVSNWNATRADKAEYIKALDRMDTEVNENFVVIDSIDTGIQQSLRVVRQAVDALQSCTESEENKQSINAGLEEIRGTYGIHLRRHALDELISNPRLLSLQTDTERKRFKDMAFYFDLVLVNAVFGEDHPLEDRFQNNPIIGVGGLEEFTGAYYDVDFSQPKRQIFLNASVNEACRNDQLIKSFYTWESWQDNVPILSRQIRNELDATKALLVARK